MSEAHDPPESSSPASRTYRILTWLRGHKLKTILTVFFFYLMGELLTIPFFEVLDLSDKNPSETALMRQRIEEARLRGKPLRIGQRWASLSIIPKHVIDAIIVAEDGTFYSHSGIDWYEVQESIEKNLKVGRAARGASTITQQLAKNLYLSTSKTPMRKLKEFVITKFLEMHLGKDRILEIYLNVIELGDGIFGIEAAAQEYFGKSVRELTLDEATRIAAVIPSPLRYKPNVDSRYVTRMKAIVLRRMMARNFVIEPPVEGETQDTVLEPATAPYEAVPIPEFEDSMDFIDSTYIEEGWSNGL